MADSNLATIAWSKLKVYTKDTKGGDRVILNSVSGYLAPRHMLAIMGPSGCGKSTLLDTLAGRLSKNLKKDGQVLLNGYESSLSYGVSAYVTQDEMMVGTLSVRETLWFAAMLRLPRQMATCDKVARVEEVIQELGLEICQHTKIGNWFLKGISGGQKRRVAIGCELITHPTLMFLDEPTSGLDAASAYFVMATIRRLVEHNRTILSVIHQPSSEVYELFDKLCLLSQGNVVYFGDADKALSMFDSAGVPCPSMRNPADHFLHAINLDFKSADAKALEDGKGHDVESDIKKLITTYQTTMLPEVEQTVSKLSAKGAEYKCTACHASRLTQMWVLSYRMFLNNARNIGVFWLRLGMYIGLCICIGTVYFDLGTGWLDVNSRAAMLFFVVAFLTFMSISAFPAFQEDMAVFVRERLNGYYGVSTFVVANTVSSAPFIFLIAIVSSAVVYWLVGLNDQGDRFVYYFVNLYVSLTVVESLMMAIAAIVPHYLMGIAAGAGIMGMFMLVCGFFQPVGQLPKPIWLYPLHYMAYHSYAFAGFMHNEFDGTSGWDCPCSVQSPPCTDCTYSGAEVLSTWTIDGLNKWVDVGIQVGMAFIYRIGFFCMLKFKEWLSRR